MLFLVVLIVICTGFGRVDSFINLEMICLLWVMSFWSIRPM